LTLCIHTLPPVFVNAKFQFRINQFQYPFR
jgi:hypothetical protein